MTLNLAEFLAQCVIDTFWRRGEAKLRKHLREHGQKAAWLSEIRK